jgi:hypothetical protein
MEMVLEYAKVFPENADMGDPEGNKTAKSIHDKGGQYVVNLYFTDEEQIQKLLEEGLDPKPMNSDRILNGNEYGIGKYMKAKRLVRDDIKTFTQKNGTSVNVNYGGAPGVVDLTAFQKPDSWASMSDEEKSKAISASDFHKSWWSFEEGGPLGNGTEAMVQFETYSNGAGVRIVNIGVLEHVAYEANENPNSEYDAMFKVA